MVLDNNNYGVTPNQVTYERPRKRPLIVIVLALFVIIGAVVLFMVIRGGSSSKLTVSDIVMKNVQQMDTLSGQKFNFNTGSAVASVDLAAGGTYKSSVNTSDTPYSQIFKADYRESSQTLLAQILYSEEDFYAVNGLQKPLSGPQQIWITQGQTGDPTVFNPFGDTKKIIDAKFSSSGIIMLVSEGEGSNSLYSYDGSPKLLSQNVPDNQILAVTDKMIVAREANGKTNLYSQDGKKISAVESGNEKVLVEKATSSVIQQANDKLVVEGDGKKTEYKVKEKNAFVANGVVVLVDSLILPKQLTVLKLKEKQRQTYSVDFSNSAITESIIGVVSLSDNADSFGLITESSSLMIASTNKEFVNGLKTYVFPEFKNTDLVNYNLGANEAILYSTNIPQSLTLSSQDCGCDLNQIHKFWQKSFDSNSYQPNLGEPEEGEEENF